MKIELIFAELHSPLFLGGTNWQMKLFQKSAKGKIDMAYDRDNKELLVKCKDAQGKEHIAIIPTSNVVSMTPIPEGLAAYEHKLDLEMQVTPAPGSIPPPRGKRTAQASGPHDHVFAGNGAGKTRDK